MKRLFYIAILLALNACDIGKIKEKKVDVYFDVKALIDEQISILDSLQPQINKSISIDGEREEKQIKFDSSAWANELEIFNLADINKPVLQDQYNAYEGKVEEKKRLRYESKSEDPGIQELEIYFDGQDLVQQLAAVYKEQNYLYTSYRKLQLEFDTSSGISVLSSYSVSGQQKMVMKDEVDFRITSTILYDN